jgi:hypothetical protein
LGRAGFRIKRADRRGIFFHRDFGCPPRPWGEENKDDALRETNKRALSSGNLAAGVPMCDTVSLFAIFGGALRHPYTEKAHDLVKIPRIDMGAKSAPRFIVEMFAEFVEP